MIFIEVNWRTLQEERTRLGKLLLGEENPDAALFIEASISTLNWIENLGESPSEEVIRIWNPPDET